LKAMNLIYCLTFSLLAGPYLALANSQTVENLYQAKWYVDRGDKYRDMNLWDEAEQEYWNAVAQDYFNIRARQGLGDVYRKKQMFDKAIENYQMVLNQQPTNVDIQYLISLSYYDNRQYELARVSAEKALQMNPELAKAENLVRLSESKQKEQELELQLLRQKETQALLNHRQIQERKENAFIGTFLPGWRLIQTAETRTMVPGYMILGGTVGFLIGGHFLRSSGQKNYDLAGKATSAVFYNYYADLGQKRYRAGGYMINIALGVFALNLVDSFLLKGKIFGGKTRVKPSLPERDRHKLY
jgi:tetratricopeptide (TPR) repeat protein